MTIEEKQAEIVEEFELFDDWLQKYDYLIEMGKSLPTIVAFIIFLSYYINISIMIIIVKYFFYIYIYYINEFLYFVGTTSMYFESTSSHFF